MRDARPVRGGVRSQRLLPHEKNFSSALSENLPLEFLGCESLPLTKFDESPFDEYRTFEASVTAEYDAETVIERELVLRLVNLLWRLRRAGAIETGLMQIQGESAQ